MGLTWWVEQAAQRGDGVPALQTPKVRDAALSTYGAVGVPFIVGSGTRWLSKVSSNSNSSVILWIRAWLCFLGMCVVHMGHPMCSVGRLGPALDEMCKGTAFPERVLHMSLCTSM